MCATGCGLIAVWGFFALAAGALAFVLTRSRLGLIVAVGTGVWSAALTLHLLDLLNPAHHLATIVTVAFLVALPIVFMGFRRDGGAHRAYVGAALTFDAGLVTLAWLVMLWRRVLWDGPVGFASVPWTDVGGLALELAIASCVILVVAGALQPGGVALALGQAFMVASNAVEFMKDGHQGAQAALAGAALAVTLAGFFRAEMPGPRTREEALVADRRRGATAAVLVVAPLTLAFRPVAGRPVDSLTVTLAVSLILLYGAREFHRSRQARELVELLQEQALTDPVSGLPNRRALIEHLTLAAERGQSFCVLSVDIDRFKEVNRQLGHQGGDATLRRVGAALQAATDAAYRLGGDEFAVVVTGSQGFAYEEAERLRRVIPQAMADVPGLSALAITLSIGIAADHPDDDTDVSAILTRSAQALRLAKTERNRVRVYSEDDAARIAHRALVEQRLRAALGRGDVVFSFQPIVEMPTERVVSLEVLARWTDDELGTVSPLQFVPVAEQTGLIHQLGASALDSALSMVTHLRRNGHEVKVSVNVSPVQLRRATFDHDLAQALEAHGARAEWLTLEVTESIFMDMEGPAVQTLHRVAASGVTIAIDDFGSGYSSLAYLAGLPAGVVKVDRSLIVRMDSSRTRSVIQALIQVAEAHGLKVIMEGVETHEQADALMDMGARLGQGWVWHRAVDAEHLPGLLTHLAERQRSGRET